MFAAVLLSAVFLFFCPMTAPSVPWLVVDRSLIQVCITQLLCQPLIMDYVKQGSRGKASSIQYIGHMIGETFAIGVIFELSARYGQNQNQAFLIGAAIVAVLSIPVLFLVKNPTISS